MFSGFFQDVSHPVRACHAVGFWRFYLCLCDTCMERFKNVGASALKGSWENENKRGGEPRAKRYSCLFSPSCCSFPSCTHLQTMKHCSVRVGFKGEKHKRLKSEIIMMALRIGVHHRCFI